MIGAGLRRLLGGVLLVLSFTPLYLLLDAEDDALRRASVDVAGSTLGLVHAGTLLVLLLGVLLALFVPPARVLPTLERVGRRLESVRVGTWAAGVALLAAGLASAINLVLFRGLYTNIDEIASFIQARYFAAGRLAGPLPVSPEGWLVPNMLTVDAGWVSQFPPSHLALLAAGEATGIPVLVGPLLFAMLAALATLCAARLLPAHGRVVRLTGLLVAVSPFLVLLGAGGWSHASAGAFLWLALYAALRARDGHAGWSILAGASIGVAVCSRPWISLLLGTLGTLAVWIGHAARRDEAVVMDDATSGQAAGAASKPLDGRAGWLARRCVGTVAGGLPFAILLGAYNRALFGSAGTLGYLAAFGERHGLGFHQDPWGNAYTPLDALALTSGDVIVFGTQLLETPVPLGAVLGGWLLVISRMSAGARILVAWALLPVAGNAVYWFHSTRMMYEAAPAWIALGLLAVAPLFRPSPSPPLPPPPSARPRLDPRGVGLWATVASVAMAVGLNAPQRIGGGAGEDDGLARPTVPQPPEGGPALVFIHTSWNERLSARLQGAGGMRQDSVISLLRRNTNCELDAYTRARAERAGGPDVSLPAIDLRQQAGTPADVVRRAVADGATLRTREGERFGPECQRELSADRFGAVALAPLLWQGDLPGIERGEPLFVRDLGPAWNQRLVRHYADRTPWVFVPKTAGAPPELVPYEEAMRVLWGG